jgi:hypothetical protein
LVRLAHLAHRIRSRLTFANVTSLLALFVALGGTSYAALHVGSKQIVNNSVRSKDIRNNDLRSADVRNGSLLPADFKPGALPAGPRGLPGRSALTTLKSGETIRGVWATGGGDPDTSVNLRQGIAGVTFPVPAPGPVDSLHVVLAGNDTAAGSGSGCTGSATAPVAAPGFVCLYVGAAMGTSAGAGYGALATFSDSVATGDGSPYGFAVRVFGSQLFRITGTWAYQAP